MKVETTDIYQSAYLMAKGINLNSMNVLSGGKREKIVFILKGPKELGRLNRDFEQGKALINPVDLKKSILHLKDMMYDSIRKYREENRDANQQRRDRGR